MEQPVVISHLSQYLRYLEAQNRGLGLTLYRGQRKDWPLLPDIARNGEYLLQVESEIFDAFRREAIAIIGNAPDNLWDWIALAQHHRLPTRLLDWTKNPLAGLWFAVRETIRDTTCPGVVWVLKPEDADVVRDVSGNPGRFERSPSARSPLQVEKTMVFEPRHVTPRIRAQSGMVTIHRRIDGELTTPLEQDPDYMNRLTKLSVPADHFEKLRAQLLDCGVHDGSLFPDLDGLASRIRMGSLKVPKPPLV